MTSPLDALLEVNGDEDLAELCARLGDVLALDAPVPEAALLRATADPAFARDLLACRGVPGFLQAHFDNPATLVYAHTSASTSELAARAARAFVRWGKTGFSTVDTDVLARREAACLACPHLREPIAAVQKAMAVSEADRLGARTGRRVCDLCGCNVAAKMRLPSESCPGRHPSDPHVTRWGEALAIGTRAR
jgi:hypothetical protein